MFLTKNTHFHRIIFDMHPAGTKIVHIPVSKILHERQGKILKGEILEIYSKVPAFLRGQLLSNWQSYGWNKIFCSVIQRNRNVLKISKINVISEKNKFSCYFSVFVEVSIKNMASWCTQKDIKEQFSLWLSLLWSDILCCIVYGAALTMCPIEILQKSSDFRSFHKTQPKRENPTIFANVTAQALLHIWGRHYEYVICSLGLQKVCETPWSCVKSVKRCHKLVEGKSSRNIFRHDFRVPL